MNRIVASIAVCILVSSGIAMAAPGDLDLTFGDAGVAIAQIPGEALSDSAALQPDGKILVAGGQWNGEGPYRYDFSVVRFTTDGTLDPSFGDAGIVRIDPGSSPLSDYAAAIAVAPDARIVVGGWSGFTDSVIVRLLEGGGLDPTFGVGGKVVLNAPGVHEIWALAIEPDHSIVALSGNCVVLRLLEDGSLDASFGTGGFAATSLHSCPKSILRLANEKLAVAGHFDSENRIRLLRLHADGSLDPSFGVGGIASGPLGIGTSSYGQIEVDDAGRFIVLGRAFAPNFPPGPVLVRFTADGTLDASFGSDGVATLGPAPEELYSVAHAGAGSIVATGFRDNGPATATGVVVHRVLANGDLDPTFGTGGSAMATRDYTLAGMTALIQADGRIVVTGYHEPGPHNPVSLFFAARFLASNCGDGVIDADEECDDGNTVDGDCCSSTCRVETAGCVPLGICAGLGDAQLSVDTRVQRTVLRSGAPASGLFDRWGTGGTFKLRPVQSLEPLTEVVRFELAQGDGGGGITSLYGPRLDPADCAGGSCFLPEGISGESERRARFRLRGRDADITGAPGWRRALLERRGGVPEAFRFALAGKGAAISTPEPIDGIRRVRQSLRVGDQCVTTTLDCRPIIAGRFLRCGPARCGNGSRDRGEQCGEPGLSNCGAGRTCDTCRCVRTP